MKKRKVLAVLTAAVLALQLAACGSAKASESAAGSDSAKAEDANTEEAGSSEGGSSNHIVIGCNISVSGVNDYLDEDDNLTGATVELMRAIDDKLEDYEFEYVPTSFDDVFVGIEAGTYQGGEANCFLTKERIEKYAIPNENIGASYIGLLVKKELGDLTSFEDVANRQKSEGLTFYSMQAGNGLTYPVEVYNEQHPDNQIEFEYTSENTNSEVNNWIINGRYDVGLALYSNWLTNYVAEDGAYHDAVDDLVWIPIQIVGVYNLFNKDKVDQKFLDAYDAALKELKEDGKAQEISKQFYGYDPFEEDIKDLTDN
ncbi:transporter substrate-binding domain-containing protein [Butyrivibrio sp. INlla16]|uniref:transporter substrate-binding domain-containing protein n=1 Tax=Butyrivibrio sp. INlla16 TaxID=1520807 RepID=UPI00089198CC|nr:transporter substrate-binding domain-containing protein [Butyrivibrio sp. INlla16]SDB43005.1 L-cystine transport system substrate-binding protein [Butyrivibrio sp. INlla16]